MIYVLGNVCRDITMRVDALPRKGETIIARETYTDLGGKGLNQAVAAHRASDSEVLLVAPVGEDNEEVKRALDSEGMSTRGLLDYPGTTDVSIVTASAEGGNFVVTNARQSQSLAFADVEGLLTFDSADLLMLQGNLPEDTSFAAAHHAKAQGAGVLLNPAPWSDWCAGLVEIADVAIMNEVEAKLWGGVNSRMSSRQQAKPSIQIFTLGAKGCRVTLQDKSIHDVPAPTTAVTDTTGAGDIFAGVFATEWHRHRDPLRAARLAVLAASDSVTRKGAMNSIPARSALAEMRRRVS